MKHNKKYRNNNTGFSQDLLRMSFKENEWSTAVLEVREKLPSPISVKIVMNENDFYALKNDWNKIVQNSSATIYQTFEWLYNWWKYFGKGNQYNLHIILIYLSDESKDFEGSDQSKVDIGKKLIGIGPFLIHNRSIAEFRVSRQIRLLGCGLHSGKSGSNAIEQEGLSDYLDVICDDEFKLKVAETLSSYFTYFKYIYDEIDFQNISNDSFIFTNLLPLMQKNEFNIAIKRSDICPRLIVPETFDSFMGSVKSSTRRRLKQTLKNVEEGSLCKIEEVSLEDYDSSLLSLNQLHQKRWNELGYPGLFSDARVGRFVNEVNKEFLKLGILWFKILKINDKVIAARLGFKFNNRVYDYLSGFDNISASASLRPGLILILEMIKDAVAYSWHIVDFLRGAEEYKFEISSELGYNYHVIINHTESQRKFKTAQIKILEYITQLLHRIKNEKSIVILHAKLHGKILFVKPYLKFCFKRIQIIAGRSNIRIRPEEKTLKSNKYEIELANDKKKLNKHKLNEIEINA